MSKQMKLYDPPMGSPTGIGLVSQYDQKELLRVATLVYQLKQRGIEVERANLSTVPKAFLEQDGLMDKLMEEGNDFLPAVYDENGVLVSGRYPSNEEVATWYQQPDLAEHLPDLPPDEFVALWQEAEAWGMCNTSDCSTCGGCG